MTTSKSPRLRRRGRVLVAITLGCGLVASCTDGGSSSSESSVPTDSSSTTAVVENQEDATPIDQASGTGFQIDTVLAADPNCGSPVVGDPLRIGYAADLSELGGPADQPASVAALHLARLINCSGGLDGRPVEVIIEDVSGDPLETRAAVKRLLDAGAHVLLGPPFPDPGFRVLQVTDGEYPVIFTGSTEPALGDPTAQSYLVAFNDTQGATAAANFSLGQGWTRAVTFTSPGPYFGYNTLVYSGVFEARGGQIVGDYQFVPGETLDFTDAVAEIALNPPDVIYTPMFAEQLISLRQQLVAAGVTEVEFIQSDAFEATGGYSFSDIEGIYHVTHAFPSEGSRIVALGNSLAAATGQESLAPSMMALAGDAIAVIATAYLAAGSTDPRALGDAIASVESVDGITGSLSYGGMGTPSKPIYIHRVENGLPTLAATIEG